MLVFRGVSLRESPDVGFTLVCVDSDFLKRKNHQLKVFFWGLKKKMDNTTVANPSFRIAKKPWRCLC